MKRNTGPLRKIVGHVQIQFLGVMVWREQLECGHLVVERQDIYGPTNASRRRCRKCQQEQLQESAAGTNKKFSTNG